MAARPLALSMILAARRLSSESPPNPIGIKYIYPRLRGRKFESGLSPSYLHMREHIVGQHYYPRGISTELCVCIPSRGGKSRYNGEIPEGRISHSLAVALPEDSVIIRPQKPMFSRVGKSGWPAIRLLPLPPSLMDRVVKNDGFETTSPHIAGGNPNLSREGWGAPLPYIWYGALAVCSPLDTLCFWIFTDISGFRISVDFLKSRSRYEGGRKLAALPIHHYVFYMDG